MQVYIVMYQDSNGQKYADDVFVNHGEAQMRARSWRRLAVAHG